MNDTEGDAPNHEQRELRDEWVTATGLARKFLGSRRPGGCGPPLSQLRVASCQGRFLFPLKADDAVICVTLEP